ncbi:MAG: acetylglutamate kinase [Rikenellaceae bacterium]|jgi:acetylglutamate kinase|nr:acetylglutamate kinase [Rikenellaceae bacterium]
MLKIVKIGGNIVDNPAKLDRFLVDLSTLPGDKVLVHGGGKVATTISQSLGIETQMIDGRRVTAAETLKVVTMVYAGVINKTIVSNLQGRGCNAVGLCGADGALITSRRRSPEPVDYGFVGDPEKVNTALITDLTAKGFTLVIAPITYDGTGGLLNTNADTVASALAAAMAARTEVELIYCFEKAGVLMDVDDDNSVIPEITPDKFADLKARSIVAAGMLPKLENAFRSLEKGVKKVVICSAEKIAEKGYGGTSIRL